ncbi:MAG: hypothetical protein WA414_17090 [Acidobacteriaceae bacterium]
MCLPNENQNPRARIFLSVGMLCLVASLLPQVFGFTYGLNPTPLHFLRGFFVGLALVFIPFAGIRRRKRNFPNQPA